jgi:2-polyprenyl-3-methyl-5-hydroxy-6-metoxy-1,4-benzoquinol methylase
MRRAPSAEPLRTAGLNWYSRRRLRAMARAIVGETVLDIGCAAAPNPFLVGRQVVGFDRDPMTVAAPYTEHVSGDVYAMNDLLRGRVFDTVLCGELIEHVERPFDLLRMLRVHVAPRGRLVLSTPNLLGVPIVVAEYLNLPIWYTEEHVYAFSPRWVWRILERCGFERVSMKGCGISLPRGWWMPAPRSLSTQIVFVAARKDGGG